MIATLRLQRRWIVVTWSAVEGAVGALRCSGLSGTAFYTSSNLRNSVHDAGGAAGATAVLSGDSGHGASTDEQRARTTSSYAH